MEIAINLIGGLGMFLYGMNVMGDGLQKAAGARLKKIIELLTSNVIMGVLVGMVVTMIVQSSSATTVMVVGFVNAGIMSLPQAIGVIMGANIGTTITAQLVSLDVDFLAPVALGVGIILYMFSNKTKTKHLAEIFLGFGILFVGMDFMKDAVKPLAEFQGFTDMLANFGHNPILGVLMGFAITVIVQSSSASMGMLLALASEGLIPLAAALPILYGENIGTCVTSLLSSIGASRNAKRAAIMHLTFNVIGSLIFMLALSRPISAIVTNIDPNDVARQIANAHTLFNIINVLLLLPFNKLIVKLALKLVPTIETEEDDDSKVIKYIDERMIETPSIALANLLKEVSRMGQKAKDSFRASIEGLEEKSSEKVSLAFRREVLVNELQRAILSYLLKLSKAPLHEDAIETVDSLFNVVNDIERIGDHAENIAELSEKVIEHDLKLSQEGNKELKEMYEKVMTAYTYSLEALETSNIDLALKVVKLEEQVDMLETICRNDHLARLNKGECSIESGVIYLDIITNLERISDHSLNIAQKVLSRSIKIQ